MCSGLVTADRITALEHVDANTGHSDAEMEGGTELQRATRLSRQSATVWCWNKEQLIKAG